MPVWRRKRHLEFRISMPRRLAVTDDTALSAAIRAGEFDNRWDEVRTAIAGSVEDSLQVANPGYVRNTAAPNR